jgi:hypothetical protein
MKVTVYYLTSANIHVHTGGMACNMYQCWAVLRMRDRYPLVINPGIYSLALWFSRFSNKWSWHITVILKFFKKPENQSKNHASVEGFEITGTGGSLILNFFPNKQNRQFFKSCKNCPTLVCTSRALRQVSISNFSNYQMRVFRTVAQIRQLVSKKTSQFWSKSTSKVWVFSIVSIVGRERHCIVLQFF